MAKLLHQQPDAATKLCCPVIGLLLAGILTAGKAALVERSGTVLRCLCSRCHISHCRHWDCSVQPLLPEQLTDLLDFGDAMHRQPEFAIDV